MNGWVFKIKCWIKAFKDPPVTVTKIIIYAADVPSFSLLKLTRGAGLGSDNVAGIIRVNLEITCF